MKKLKYIIGLLACLTACADEQVVDSGQTNPADTEISVGEKIVFTTSTPRTKLSTRGVNTEVLSSYKTIAEDYKLTVTMLEDGGDAASCTYIPKAIRAGEGANQTVYYDEEGTLEADAQQGESELRWQSNVKRYAFEATAGTESVEADQSTAAKLLLQDRLHGYAYSPVTHQDGIRDDQIGVPNYHTSKEWYNLNKEWHDAEGQMLASVDYKKIPLFLQHERAWITIILKAGKGVKRESVMAHPTSSALLNQNIDASIFSYTLNAENEPVAFEVTDPLPGEKIVSYEADSNGDAENVSNYKFEAIVDPYDYTKNPDKDKIAAVSISGLKFSLYASSDDYYEYPVGSDEYLNYKEMYNLTAGKHLTIEATLSSDRIVFITAKIEDWNEVITQTICDDNGQNGDPVVIKSRQELLDFLNSDDNRAGTVAIIAAPELNLDQKVTPGETEDAEPTITTDPWTKYNSVLTLNATLNMAGSSLRTSGQFVKSLSSTASLINGTLVMYNETPVNSAVAETNEGTIERVSVTVGNRTANATRAGLVVTNYGSIVQCSNALPVDGVKLYTDKPTYVGGIAAESISKSTTSIPMIDHCTVTARVKGEAGSNGDENVVKGGGIAGLADGRLTNNTFDYGITLLQSSTNFKNIVVAIPSGKTLSASSNAWPTLADNELGGNNISNATYHNVLDSQEELEELLTSTYNLAGCRYRISDNFTVLSDSWSHGVVNEDISSQEGYCNGNLYCELDGNNKTIILGGETEVEIPTAYVDGKASATVKKVTSHMLFTNITGSVHDLTLSLTVPLIATPGVSTEAATKDKLNATDAIAPLAYAVRGSTASVSNVKVKMADDAYVQAATPAGLVCWVNEGGTVENCQVRGKVQTWVPNTGAYANNTESSDARRYAGGFVACAAQATIRQCTYYAVDNTLTRESASGKLQTFYGGIVGASTVKDINSVKEYPAVSIIDCISWYQFTSTNPDELRYHGSIIGNAEYTKDNQNYSGTISDMCQGNWWAQRGAGTILTGMTIEEVIGKCSAVTPVTPGANNNF